MTGVGRLEGRVDGDGLTSSDGLGLGDSVVGEMFGDFNGSADVGCKRRNALVEIIEYTNSSWETIETSHLVTGCLRWSS